MTEIETFLEIERIKKLRVLYSHYFDSNDLEKLATLFTDDVVCEYGSYGTWVGKEELLKNYKIAHARHDIFNNGSYPYMHIITNHWVELTGACSAEGRCYLVDTVTAEGDKNPLLLLGIYDDEYKKVDDGWKIHRTRIDFVWPNRSLIGGFPGARVPATV